MAKNWESVRREYQSKKLAFSDLPTNPIDLLEEWLQNALDESITDATAMSLATVDNDYRVSNRIVLLKKIQEDQIIFYTNYNSSKCQNIFERPHVSMCLYWKEMCRQVRMSGHAEKTSRQDSEQYFNSRPIESQISAIVSKQSESYRDRTELEREFNELKQADKAFVCPEYWGGIAVKLDQLEFWQGRESRLHDRFQAKRDGNHWSWKLLGP